MINVIQEFKNDWRTASRKRKIEFIIDNLTMAIFAGFALRATALFTISVNNGDADYIQSTLALAALLVIWIIGHKEKQRKD